MSQYCQLRDLPVALRTEDMANSWTMRPDPHTTFDAQEWIAMLKDGKMVSHFLKPTADMGKTYQNRSLRLR